jgi:phosphatidylglycerophosphatase C
LTGALAVFDLDGTITRRDTLGPFLLGYLKQHPWRVLRIPFGLLAPFSYLIDRDRGAIKGAAIRTVMGGSSRERVERWADEFVAQLIPRSLFAEALAAIAQHRARGDRLLLMSASTDLYVPRIGKALGFHEVICSQVRWRPDGRLDGRLSTPNCHGEEKRRCLAAVLARDAPERVYAYGNAGSDLLHMALAHEAFLVNGPAALTAQPRAGEPSGQLRALTWQQRAALH